VSSLSCE